MIQLWSIITHYLYYTIYLQYLRIHILGEEYVGWVQDTTVNNYSLR